MSDVHEPSSSSSLQGSGQCFSAYGSRPKLEPPNNHKSACYEPNPHYCARQLYLLLQSLSQSPCNQTANCLPVCNLFTEHYRISHLAVVSLDSSVGIVTRYGLDCPGIEFWWGGVFHDHPDRPWGQPSLLYNGYRVFPECKAGGA